MFGFNALGELALGEMPSSSGATYSLSISTINYTLTVNDVSFVWTRPFAFGTLSYALSIKPIGLVYNKPFAFDTVNYTYTLNDVGLSADYRLVFAKITYALSFPTWGYYRVDLSPLEFETIDYVLTIKDLDFGVELTRKFLVARAGVPVDKRVAA